MREAPGNARRNDDPSFALLDQRKKYHRDVDNAKGIDVINTLVVFDSHPLDRPQSSADASVVKHTPQSFKDQKKRVRRKLSNNNNLEINATIESFNLKAKKT